MDIISFLCQPKLVKNLAFACFLILVDFHVSAQSKILDEYVQEGIKNNLALKQKIFSVDKSMSALKEAKAMFWPDISFDATYTLADGGRSFEFPVGDLFNPIYTNLNAINGNSNFPTNLENSETSFLANDFHETRIRGILPILNTDIYYKAQ